MDQWRSKFSESFSLDRYWSIEFSSLLHDISPTKPREDHNVQRAPNLPELAQPRLSRVNERSCPARGYTFGCVCSYMAGVISHQRNDWPCRNKHTQIAKRPNLYPLSLGMTALWPYSNGAVQIRSWGFGARWSSCHESCRRALPPHFTVRNLLLGDEIQGLLGDNKRDENPVFGTTWTHVLSGLRWLKVA